MSKIDCELLCPSNNGHLQQIYTGFRLLESQSKINLTYRLLEKPFKGLQYPAPSHLLVRINENFLVCYDTIDFGELRIDILNLVDFYFKRSFSSNIIGQELAYKKVFPLGLNFKIHEKYVSLFSVSRILKESLTPKRLLDLAQEFVTPINNVNPRLFRLHVSNCFTKPKYSLEPRVIFYVNLWDPLGTKDKYQDSRNIINQMRVECIIKLRKYFGKKFIGGLIPNEYATKNYPNLLIQDPRACIFGNYIRTLQNVPIGIATTGLHGSIGWKFAEYIAFSRAVVSEKLVYEAPGLDAGKNYLEFETADECVEKAALLMDDPSLRKGIMENNHYYHQNYLRPDILVWRTLSTTLNDK